MIFALVGQHECGRKMRVILKNVKNLVIKRCFAAAQHDSQASLNMTGKIVIPHDIRQPYLPPFKTRKSGGQIFFRMIPVSVPITITKTETPKYSARQRSVFVIGRAFRHRVCNAFSKNGIWIAKSQKENPAKYFAALKTFSLFTIKADNFRKMTQSAKTINQRENEYSPPKFQR